METAPAETTPAEAMPTEPTAAALRFDLTPLAARKVYEALRKRGTPGASLRVGVRGGGCSGYTYVLEFADGEPRARDLVFRFPVGRLPEDTEEPGEVRVLCDKKSILFLNGGGLDWQKTLMYQGFRFVNPHEKSSCGCKESFAV
jgi:iron-sulfur cluster assembly protein